MNNTFNPVKNKEEWQALILEHAESGLSQTEFCQQKNISVSKFGYHRSLLMTHDKFKTKAQNIFTPIHIKKPEPITANIRLILSNGFQCFLPCHIDPNQVKQLLRVLLSC
jgi:hypothetical protein